MSNQEELNAFTALSTDGVVGVISGGMDSTTLAYMLKDAYKEVSFVSFNYGQRHKTELQYAEKTATRLDVEWCVVDLQSVPLGRSALLGTADVPHGHYAEDSMRVTVVPNRNAIMLNIAAGIAISKGVSSVATGVHAGDHPVYPDCRPAFIDALNKMLAVATDTNIRVEAPFVAIDKAEIAKIGQDLGVVWTETWSCYEGGEVHCGRCSTCVERREAFDLAGVLDPTEYTDDEFYYALKEQGKVGV